MVRRGEYLERAVVVPHGDATLDGLYHRGARMPPVLVVSPHPHRGRMELPIIAEIAWAVTRAGHATLRFDYPGVGASPGQFDEQSAVDAFGSAHRHLRLSVGQGEESMAPAPAVIAVGWGAMVAASGAATMAVDRMILVQPPTSVWPRLDGFEGPVLAVLAGADSSDDRAAASEGAAARSNGAIDVVAHADTHFRRGLVGLGQVIVKTLEKEEWGRG